MTTKNNIQRLESYNSYSGCDMIATAQITSHSGLKDKVYTLGSIQTISISTHQDKRPVRSLGNINAKEYTMGQRTIAGSLVFAVFDKHFADQMFKDSLEASEVGVSTILLPDELPPFDITISYANEYGHASKMRLYGVRLVNEGQVMSVNDIYTENTYQFVATGLEPLSKEPLSNISKSLSAISDSEIKQNSSKVNNNSVNRILDFNDFNFISKGDESINLTVSIEQPLSKDDYGIVKFNLTPDQDTGVIKIHPSNSDKVMSYELSTKNDVYYMMLPIDNYYAYYENNDKISNTVNFSVYCSTLDIASKTDMPIIEYTSSDSISIIANNKSHTHAVCIKESNTARSSITVELSSKKALFTDLECNTYYRIYTINKDNSESEYIIAQTLEDGESIMSNFINFVSYNKDLLIDDLNKYIELLDNTQDKNNTVDSILDIKAKDNSEYLLKQELLLYAVKFQNIINNNLNKDNPVKPPYKNIKEAFTNSFMVPKDSKYFNIFRREKNKNYFEDRINSTDTYTYEGKNNIKYMAININSHNSRSCNYDFCCFDFNAKEHLNKYRDTNKLYSLSNTVDKVSSVNNYKNIARSYKKPGVPVLQRPRIIIDKDLVTYIDMECYNHLPLDKSTLKLVISNVSECLDTTPHIKVDLNRMTTIDNFISLEQKETGILLNNSYAMWIEDEELGQISYCETVDTYNDDILTTESLDIKISELEKEINKIIKYVSQNLKLSNELMDCIKSIAEQEDTHISNLHEKIIEALIDNKALCNDIAYMLFLILSSKHSLDPLVISHNTDKVTYDKNNSTLQFDKDTYNYFSVISINNETGLISKHSKYDSNDGLLLLSKDRFVIVHKSSDKALRRTGFVLIDQNSKEIFPYNMKVEVI